MRITTPNPPTHLYTTGKKSKPSHYTFITNKPINIRGDKRSSRVENGQNYTENGRIFYFEVEIKKICPIGDLYIGFIDKSAYTKGCEVRGNREGVVIMGDQSNCMSFSLRDGYCIIGGS